MEKKTFADIRNFNVQTDVFVKRNPVHINTKLGYAIKKISNGQIGKIVKDYQNAYTGLYFDMVEKRQVDLALTDKATGAILNAPQGSQRPYLFTPENLKLLMEAEREFRAASEKLMEEWDAKEFDITPHYAVETPEDLTEAEKAAFTGFVIAPEEVK